MNSEISFHLSSDLKTLRDFAEIAYYGKLLVNGFNLQNVLPEIFEENRDEILRSKNIQIALLKKKETFIGICLFQPKEFYSINTYIVPEERNLGYSTDLIKFMLAHIEDESLVRFGEGEIQSLLFFKKLFQLSLVTEDNFDCSTFFKIKALINFEKIKKSEKNVADSDLAELRFFSNEERAFFRSFIPQKTKDTIHDVFHEANLIF